MDHRVSVFWRHRHLDEPKFSGRNTVAQSGQALAIKARLVPRGGCEHQGERGVGEKIHGPSVAVFKPAAASQFKESAAGGNELFSDGSARWIPFEKMYYLTTWQPDFRARQCFFYQDPVDFDPALVSALPLLSAKNFR